MAIKTRSDWTIDRRGLFSGAGAALLGGIVAFGARAKSASLKVDLVSAARVGEIDGGALIGADGLAGFSLPGRAHAGLGPA